MGWCLHVPLTLLSLLLSSRKFLLAFSCVLRKFMHHIFLCHLISKKVPLLDVVLLLNMWSQSAGLIPFYFMISKSCQLQVSSLLEVYLWCRQGNFRINLWCIYWLLLELILMFTYVSPLDILECWVDSQSESRLYLAAIILIARVYLSIWQPYLFIYLFVSCLLSLRLLCVRGYFWFSSCFLPLLPI